MQEVFLRAYRNLYSLRHPHRFRSWLYTIMSNECNRWLARAAKTHRSEVQLAHASDDDLRVQPGHAVPTEGWKVDLEQAIAALSDENRVAVSMFYMGDCTLKEISDFLGVSVNTVKTKLHRARQQLGRTFRTLRKSVEESQTEGRVSHADDGAASSYTDADDGVRVERRNRWQDRILVDYGIVHLDWTRWRARRIANQLVRETSPGGASKFRPMAH